MPKTGSKWEFAIPLTPGSTTNFGTLMSGKFPAVGSGSTMTPGADAVSGDVTISFPAGASIFIDTLVYNSTDQCAVVTALALP